MLYGKGWAGVDAVGFDTVAVHVPMYTLVGACHGVGHASPRPRPLSIRTGDDFEFLGLTICPDLDTVMYTLAGVADPGTGWGIEGDTHQCLDAMARLGGATWFRVGDRDLATHLLRTDDILLLPGL